MKTLSVVSSKTKGDALHVNESPWFRVAIANLVGRYNPRWGFDYRAWSAILMWCDSRQELLVSLPVAHGCAISEQLWGSSGFCWHGNDDDQEQ